MASKIRQDAKADYEEGPRDGPHTVDRSLGHFWFLNGWPGRDTGYRPIGLPTTSFATRVFASCQPTLGSEGPPCCSPTVATQTGSNRDQPGFRTEQNRSEAPVSSQFTPVRHRSSEPRDPTLNQ